MEIKYFCSMWGFDSLDMESFLEKIKSAGFDGVELGIPFSEEEQNQLKSLLEKYKLDVIAHQYQATGDFEEYKDTFLKSLENAAKFNPLFINSHTARDYWSAEKNVEVINIADSIQDKYDIKIFHETHRKHFLFSTLTAKQYFKLLPNLKITADLSHWTCVSETMLEDQKEILELGIARTEHIHARVGFEEGPQISDPRAKEWDVYLKTFTNWWQRIADRFKKENREYLTITPEFGPVPYTWTVPHTNKPVADFFEMNCWMKDYLKKELTY